MVLLPFTNAQKYTLPWGKGNKTESARWKAIMAKIGHSSCRTYLDTGEAMRTTRLGGKWCLGRLKNQTTLAVCQSYVSLLGGYMVKTTDLTHSSIKPRLAHEKPVKICATCQLPSWFTQQFVHPDVRLCCPTYPNMFASNPGGNDRPQTTIWKRFPASGWSCKDLGAGADLATSKSICQILGFMVLPLWRNILYTVNLSITFSPTNSYDFDPDPGDPPPRWTNPIINQAKGAATFIAKF